MTYVALTEYMDAEEKARFDSRLYGAPTAGETTRAKPEPPKPRSTGTRDVMKAMGMQRK